MHSSNLTNILTILFENEINREDIPSFRGAVIHSLEKKSLLFHNHEGDGFRYSYPLIQYKRIRKKAAIFCIGQGTEEIGELFIAKIPTLQLNKKAFDPVIEKIIPQKYRIQIWDQVFDYKINNWIPLNSRNYLKYCELDDPAEKKHFLERILIGNILSFAKGIGVRFEKEIKCDMYSFSETYRVKVKDTIMQCFDARFKCNVSLPNYLGLGKHVSINYGVVTKNMNETNKLENE